MSDHTLSQDLGALASVVAAVSPELADRAEALEAALATEREARKTAERRLAALESRMIVSVLAAQRGCSNATHFGAFVAGRHATLTAAADAIIAEQGPQKKPHQEAHDATQ